MRAGKSKAPHDVMDDIKKGSLKPLYLIYGEEDYLKQEAYGALKARVVTPDNEDFNYEVFYGKDARVEDVVTAASTMPTLAGYRLILVKDADSLKKNFWEEMLSYLDDPNGTTVLVFLAAELKGVPDKAKKALKKRGTIAQFRHPFENMIPAYLKREAAKWSKKIDRDAISFLIDMVGTDLKVLAGEVEKAAMYIGDRKNISLEDVEVLAGDLKVQNVFQLGEAVGRRDSGEAIRILNKLTTARGKELFILNMLARHFRRLATAMELLDAGLDRAEVGKQLGINPYFRNKFFQQLKSYSDEELQNVFLHILNCDRTIKSSKLSPRLALEMMLLRICALN